MNPYHENDHLRTYYVMRDLHDRDVFHFYLYVTLTSKVYGARTVKWLLFSLPIECLEELVPDERQAGKLKTLDLGESIECEIHVNLEIKKGRKPCVCPPEKKPHEPGNE